MITEAKPETAAGSGRKDPLKATEGSTPALSIWENATSWQMRCLTVPVVPGAGLRGELSLALSLAVLHRFQGQECSSDAPR